MQDSKLSCCSLSFCSYLEVGAFCWYGRIFFESICPELGNKMGNVNCSFEDSLWQAFSPISIANKTRIDVHHQ